MNLSLLRKAAFAAGLAAAVAVLGAGGSSPQGQPTGLTARITLRDGTVRTASLEGVGCSISLCSRTTIKGGHALKPVEARFEQLAAITDTSSRDAVWVMKDGSRQRVPLLKDFRVMYLSGPFGTPERVDLSKIASIEFR